MRGSFTFVIWDTRSGTLFAVPDAVGTDPFFYGKFGAVFAASPSADAVAGCAGGRVSVSAVAAAAYVLGASLPLERTLYEDVKRLPQGHLLELRGDVALVRRYWLPSRRLAGLGRARKRTHSSSSKRCCNGPSSAASARGRRGST